MALCGAPFRYRRGVVGCRRVADWNRGRPGGLEPSARVCLGARHSGHRARATFRHGTLGLANGNPLCDLLFAVEMWYRF